MKPIPIFASFVAPAQFLSRNHSVHSQWISLNGTGNPIFIVPLVPCLYLLWRTGTINSMVFLWVRYPVELWRGTQVNGYPRVYVRFAGRSPLCWTPKPALSKGVPRSWKVGLLPALIPRKLYTGKGKKAQ